jgi:hypothetical protein
MDMEITNIMFKGDQQTYPFPKSMLKIKITIDNTSKIDLKNLHLILTCSRCIAVFCFIFCPPFFGLNFNNINKKKTLESSNYFKKLYSEGFQPYKNSINDSCREDSL